MNWVKDEYYEISDRETRWIFGDWTVYEHDMGIELWWLWKFIGMFESKEDALDHVKHVERIDS